MFSTAEMAKRREFFENYAKREGFDPLVPDNWYSFSRRRVLASEVTLLNHLSIVLLVHRLSCPSHLSHDLAYAMQGAAQVLMFHNNSIPNALLELFPNIGFEKSKFVKTCTSHLILHLHLHLHVHIYDVLVFGCLCLYLCLSLHYLHVTYSVNWHKEAQRQKFFENYAKRHGFSPYSPEDWYKQSRAHIRQEKVSKSKEKKIDSLTPAFINLFYIEGT